MPDSKRTSELHDLWQQLPIPSAVKPLQEEDALTRDAVAWMDQAWITLPLPQTPARPRKLLVGRFVLMTAAALLLGAILFLNGPNSEPQGSAPPTLIATAPQRVPTPRLIETTAQQTQVLSGKVRLTMLHAQATPTSTPSTEF